MSTKRSGRRSFIDRRSLTITQFCEKHQLSLSLYHELQRCGEGPREMRIGSRIVRISPAADRDWVERAEAGEAADRGGKTRDSETGPRRQTERSKERSHASAPKQSERANEGRSENEVAPRRRKKRSKGGQRARPLRGRSGIVGTEARLDIAELKRRLRTGKRLPKDALIESSRWRLDTNCHRKRDRRIERTMLRALTGGGSSEAEQRQALEQANCTPQSPCRRLTCWLCKHHASRKSRRRLAKMLGRGVPHDDISWVTVVIAVCEPSPTALCGPMSKFRKFLSKEADKWGVVFFGRFEVDLLLDPRVDLSTTTFKRKTLRALGLDPDSSDPVAVFHVHLIAYHPGQDRIWLSVRLKQRWRQPRRTLVKPLDARQSLNEALDNLTRYTLKSLPPKTALIEDASGSCRARNRKALRLHNKLVSFLDGESGACIAKPTVTPKTI